MHLRIGRFKMMTVNSKHELGREMASGADEIVVTYTGLSGPADPSSGSSMIFRNSTTTSG